MNINFLYSLINVCVELVKILEQEANTTSLTIERNDTINTQMTLENNPALSNNSTNFILKALDKGEKEWGKAIDISHWQGKIHSDDIKKDGISKVIMKSTEGETWKDRNFVKYWEDLQNKTSIDAYHVLTITAPPEGQFKNINSQLEKVNFDKEKNSIYIAVFDPVQKGTKDQVTNTLIKLIDLLKGEEYVHIGINTNRGIWKKYIDESKYDFSQHNLWISHWTNKSEPTIPEVWKDKGWSVWQYTCDGHAKGIKGAVCLDHLNVDMVGEDMLSYHA